ncbi:hypothetical protein PIB30_075823 [Stylosanthes scabra]|uniref:Uncharacterized protein n=1 Tax=Stylosanthes scabra TaxID=79078 RepID=A0ABU6TPN3_9FABA|nr:hypothetical protein [Stylosanthes scabra]
MASSSAPASVLDDHHFRKEFDQQLFESHVRRKKVIPEVGFNLNDDEYPQIKEQFTLRGWRRLAAPNMGISKLLVQEFYANATVSDEEVANAEQLWAETDYKTRQATDQRLDEVLADLCIPGATWRLSSGQPANKSEITIARGEKVRSEDIIADNMAVIAQGLQSKGNLGFTSTIYKLCKDAGVPLSEFRRTSKIPEEKYITAKRMKSTRIPRNLPQQQQEDDDEDEPPHPPPNWS